MKYLSEEIIKDKKVLLRCDFNVPIKNNIICDDAKIKSSLKTINLLLKNNNTVIILSHFGRIENEKDKKKNTLKPVYEYLKKILDLEFISNPLDLSKINSSSKKCFLIENTRFTDVPTPKESVNDLNLAKYWSDFADAFVMDAFASLHRLHTSTAGISTFLPTYLGLLVEEELKKLSPLINNTPSPFVVIMGGAKIDDKITIIESMLQRCDKLILTGGILNTYLKVNGYNIGKSIASKKAEVLVKVLEILKTNADKVIYSNCFIVKRHNTPVQISIEEIEDDDIILDNVINLNDIIANAKIIFFNGTCGKYEESGYEIGTKKLLNDLQKTTAAVYIGGGDTGASVHKFNKENNYTYISSGGGATLEYVAYKKLAALEYIKNNDTEK